MNLQTLLRFVRLHDCTADATIKDGAIWATAHSYGPDGRHYTEWQRVGSTLAECKLWLGY